MQAIKNNFIKLALNHKVLQFGAFTLKSGRISPYFFNTGLFKTGAALAALGKSYADTIKALNISYDTLFGPAYKGIPLVTATAIALSNHHQENVPYCFNRKEIKIHGEKSQIVGAACTGKVLILDDVITAGTAKKQAIKLINAQGGTPSGILIALDRQEKGENEFSAMQEISSEFNIPIYSIVCLEDLLAYTKTNSLENFEMLTAYRERYGVT